MGGGATVPQREAGYSSAGGILVASAADSFVMFLYPRVEKKKIKISLSK